MVSYRYFVTSVLINLLLCSCGNFSHSSPNTVKQVVQNDDATESMQQTPAQQAEKLFIEANSLLTSRHHQDALTLYDRVLQIEPNNSRFAHFKLS